MLKKLIETYKGIDLSIRDSEGKTPLILLSKMGTKSATDLACYLLSKKPGKLTAKDNNGLSVDQYAILHGNIHLMRELAKTGKFSFTNIEGELSRMRMRSIGINNVLKSVSIDPTRAENAKQNNLVDKLGQPIVVFDSGFKVHEITAKRKRSSGEKLRSLRKYPFIDTVKLKRTSDIQSSMSESHKESFFEQYKALSKRSISDKCHQDQLTLSKTPLLQKQLQEEAWKGYTQGLTDHTLKSGPLSFLGPKDVAHYTQVSKRHHSATQPFLNTFINPSKQSNSESIVQL
ncbi:ankyrin repeat domain-containing protein [Piscirickettsia litoralis]|uniref:Uncharacterized protein n=1 Tax=Piscirickettsia litoralis TaxID=1891921 RepID=A0ABX3A357_9GAMM|nr:ankyrin repeat domain-containing protein [Piscirickettsia litoralis]ODN43306.1 hypothetical protein BGC07_10700 [Piscirickettsia litoralis]